MDGAETENGLKTCFFFCESFQGHIGMTIQIFLQDYVE